jgi:peptidoglycan/xylan/chitin deacetylase (PgdA/CDA1 family)
MYHQLALSSNGRWQVSATSFQRQLEDLANKGINVVTLDTYNPKNDNQVVITFDDADESLYKIGFPILKSFNFKFEIFCIGNFIGGYNFYDDSEPLVKLADLKQLQEMDEWGAGIQWHTLTHPRLPDLDKREIEKQLTVPSKIARQFSKDSFKWLCYPYGLRNKKVMSIAKLMFNGAVSVYDCLDNDRYDLKRIEINDDWQM